MTRPLVNWHSRIIDARTLGQRTADSVRDGIGSWPFVFCFFAFIVIWVAGHSVGSGWDPYPFALLGLVLGALTALQAAILLIAARRQDAISASLARHDYETNVAAAREIEQLLEINRRQLELLERLTAAVEAAPKKPGLSDD